MKRATICGVSAISGTSTITPRPCVERRRGGAQVDLGLARAGDAVQQAPLGRAAPRAPSRSGASAALLLGVQPRRPRRARADRQVLAARGRRGAGAR